jgi:hypothetical protein
MLQICFYVEALRCMARGPRCTCCAGGSCTAQGSASRPHSDLRETESAKCVSVWSPASINLHM